MTQVGKVMSLTSCVLTRSDLELVSIGRDQRARRSFGNTNLLVGFKIKDIKYDQFKDQTQGDEGDGQLVREIQKSQNSFREHVVTTSFDCVLLSFVLILSF